MTRAIFESALKARHRRLRRADIAARTRSNNDPTRADCSTCLSLKFAKLKVTALRLNRLRESIAVVAEFVEKGDGIGSIARKRGES